MSLTVKQLNADASFLLSFEPITPPPPSQSGPGPEPFTILLDPWITGASTTLHSRFSSATHRRPACITSLAAIPPPDLVIVSQSKSDHCNEPTLRQLPASGTKTVILAEPASARRIRGWKHFDPDKVSILPRWKPPFGSGHQAVVRVKVPSHVVGGDPGEVTVAFVPQKGRAKKSPAAAICITYRPPPSRNLRPTEAYVLPICHQATADNRTADNDSCSPRAPVLSPVAATSLTADMSLLRPGTPPVSSGRRHLREMRSTASLSPHARDRAVSVVFAPHGISYRSLEPFATSHLVAEAALPLTALLHCFDAVSAPWWLGGTVSAGTPAGQKIAARLGARAWVSAHDHENRDWKGLATMVARTRVYGREEVLGAIRREMSTDGCGNPDRGGGGMDGSGDGSKEKAGAGRVRPVEGEVAGSVRRERSKETEILMLGIGEEVLLTSEGLWEAELVAEDPGWEAASRPA